MLWEPIQNVYNPYGNHKITPPPPPQPPNLPLIHSLILFVPYLDVVITKQKQSIYIDGK